MIYTRQRKWALKNKTQGKCIICGKEAKTKSHCELHAKQNSIRVLAAIKRKAEKGCIKCGEPLKTKVYCEEHRIEYNQKYNRRKKKA